MCPQDCSEEEMASIKTLIPNFFGPWTGNFSKFDEIFSDDLPKMQSMPPEEHLIRNLFRSPAETFSHFGRVFIGKAAKHAIYASGVVFSTKVIFWENYLFVYLFSEFEQKIFGFLSIFGSVVRIPLRVCRGTIRGKEFLSRRNKLNIVFGFWATKLDYYLQLEMFVKTAS